MNVSGGNINVLNAYIDRVVPSNESSDQWWHQILKARFIRFNEETHHRSRAVKIQ